MNTVDDAGAPSEPSPSTLLGAALVLVLTLGVAVALLVTKTYSTPAAASPARPAAPAPSSMAAPDPIVAAGFAALGAKVRSGVVRIDVLSCGDADGGTGFLLSPTLIATVDHVVDGAVVIGLTAGPEHFTGRVVGSDPSTDLSLIEADQPIIGHQFRFSTHAPGVGEPVAAVGYPAGRRLALTQGRVTGVDRSITVEGEKRSGLIATDAPVNPGVSGGPLLAEDGTVYGLVDAKNVGSRGTPFAVPAPQAVPTMESWQTDLRAQPPAPTTACDTPHGRTHPTPLPAIRGLNNDASASIGATLDTYVQGINTGAYPDAYAALSPRLRARSDEEKFAATNATRYDFDHSVITARQVDSSTATVALAFTSLQTADHGPSGDTCDNWTIVFTMVDGYDGSWYIDAMKPYDGLSHVAC